MRGDTAGVARAHFQPELFRFLRDLAKHNDREWFARHKARYEEHVRDPMLRFIEDLGPLLRKIGPRFVSDPRPVGGSSCGCPGNIRRGGEPPCRSAASTRSGATP